MAEPLTINVTRAATAAPAVYTVPGSTEVEPLSAFASFDGSGAASAFLPSLAFYSASGLLISRTFPADSVAAGGSADVSYFPGIGAGGSSGGTAVQQTWMRNTTGRVVTNASVGGVGSYGPNGGDVAGTFVLDLLGGTINIRRTGIYAAAGSIQWDAAAVPVEPSAVEISITTGGVGAIYPSGHDIDVLDVMNQNAPGMLNLQQTVMTVGVTFNVYYVEAAGATMQLRVGQTSGVDKTMTGYSLTCERLGDTVENP